MKTLILVASIIFSVTPAMANHEEQAINRDRVIRSGAIDLCQNIDNGNSAFNWLTRYLNNSLDIQNDDSRNLYQYIVVSSAVKAIDICPVYRSNILSSMNQAEEFYRVNYTPQ